MGHDRTDGGYFMVDRDLETYSFDFSLFDKEGTFQPDPAMKDIFLRDLHALKAWEIWFDGGCGDGLAGENYFQLKKPKVKAQYYGLSYIVSPELKALQKKYPEKVKLFEGIFNDFSLDQIGKVKLITDNTGIFSYAKDNDPNSRTSTAAVMQAYVDMLAVGGVLHVANAEIKMERKVKKRVNGRLKTVTQTYFEWLKEQNIPGLIIQTNALGGARIQKIVETLQLPRVEQVSYEFHRPPRIVLRPVL